MKIFKNEKALFIFYIFLFFIVNIAQSVFTELIDDEAYYWLWSKNLAWGYFDHPPMVALWIKISSLFFNGELGVRFFSAFMFGFTIYFIWNLIDFKEKWQHIHLFFLLTTAVILFNFYGFITVPDTPLFFFTALFLYAYKQFLSKNSLKIALLLGFAMAGMLYSKYHGILVIAFVVLSNLKLLKNKYFWLACLFCFALFTPHLWWQYQNDYPSVKYHFNRSKKLYQIWFTINHFLNQLLIVGLAFPVLYYAFFKSFSKTTVFKKALQYLVIGFIAFFLLSTFKTSTQPQWTGLILIPLMVLGFEIIITQPTLKKGFIVLASLNLIALIYIRFALADEVISIFKWETHQNKMWAQTLKQNTQGLPIVFQNSFQNAAKYQFYTGVETHSYNTLIYRKNQFDLANYEANIQGKSVFEVSNNVEKPALSKKRNKIYYGKKIENYTTFQHLECVIEENYLTIKPGDSISLTFKLINPYQQPVPISNLVFHGVFQTQKQQITADIPLKINLKKTDILQALKTYKVSCKFKIPNDLEPTSSTFRIGLSFYDFPAGFEGTVVKINF
ncbi:MAG: 4-amino-4-deoxy-L-arabinose transferase [Zetaproteobacteria bacterium]|nr:4-amino-4-deoxy-L-arabinose transferase [Zetaproteobacteria bacterium]